MVDLVTRPDASPGDATEPPASAPWRRPRRPVVVLLVVAVVVGVAWALAPGAVTRVGPAALTLADDAPGVLVDGFERPDGVHVVGYEHDAYLDVAVSLPNRGPVGIEVRDLRPVLQDAPLLVPTEPWAPVAAAAGDTVAGAWRLRFDNCEAYHEREAMVVDRVEVVVRVLGRDVVEEVALDRPMLVRSPMLWQCPDRTIDRGDDRRGSGAGFRRDVP